jgi:biopolymer transport protein TolR
VFLQETETTLDQLLATLEAIAGEGVDTRIFVRGDRGTDYGTIMQVMGRINQAGFKNLGLVTLQEQDN